MVTDCNRQAGFPDDELTPDQIVAGVTFLREFLGDEYPATTLDADELVRGLVRALAAP